jgi:hypothetical protein
MFAMGFLEDPDKQQDDQNNEKKCSNADVHNSASFR